MYLTAGRDKPVPYAQCGLFRPTSSRSYNSARPPGGSQRRSYPLRKRFNARSRALSNRRSDLSIARSWPVTSWLSDMPLLAARALTSRAVVSSMRIVILVAIAMYHTNCATRYYARSGSSILDTSAGWDASVSGWFPTQVVSPAKALQCAGTGIVESNTSSWTRESGLGHTPMWRKRLLDGKRGDRVSVPRRARSRSHR